MANYRSRLLSFILSFLPGIGHLYWGKTKRGIAYLIFFMAVSAFGGMAYVVTHDGGIVLVTFIILFAIWVISIFDMLVVLLRDPGPEAKKEYYPDPYSGTPSYSGTTTYPTEREAHSERFYTILLSFIPGLGHLHLGLMQRGLSFLIAFFGLITMMFFITGVTNQTVFLLFLGILPIVWLYCMFDAVQSVHRKQAGEVLVDRTLFEEWEAGKTEGKKSKVLATLLSAFPGAGQMYLGMQKRGLQLMILFLGSFYIIDVLRLSLFLFIVPVIWCYSFFDGLQATSRYDKEILIDMPLIQTKGQTKGSQTHWIGVALLLLGAYYIGMNLILPVLNSQFPDLRVYLIVDLYLRPLLISIILIGGGIKLLGRGRRP